MAYYKGINDYPPGSDAPGQRGWIADGLLRLRAAMAQ